MRQNCPSFLGQTRREKLCLMRNNLSHLYPQGATRMYSCIRKLYFHLYNYSTAFHSSLVLL